MKIFSVELLDFFYQKEDCISIKLLKIGVSADERSLLSYYDNGNYKIIGLCFINFQIWIK